MRERVRGSRERESEEIEGEMQHMRDIVDNQVAHLLLLG